MTAPLIGLTTYGRDERNRFTLYGEYVDSVRRAGGVPVLLPPGEPGWRAWLERLDALLFTGGGDLDPALYDGAPSDSIYGVDAERDASELELARAAAASRRPTLCICRGMQILNVALGGTLIEHLPAEVGERVLHRRPPHAPATHPVEVEGEARLAALMGTRSVEPVSWHHQALRDVAPDLRVVGRAPDGVIEAVELPAHPWLLAVQWHPELSAERDPTQQRIFDGLVAAARARLAGELARRNP